ncbi:MAG: hypothetical protein HFJ46_01245 [Clostridia bacterium]|jgi:uncharacterized protein YxeA|nr:hypothetical protein [Clostridia bacterium]
MKKILLTIILVIILIIGMVSLSGCTVKVETTDNSVSASIDGKTTEKVDGVIDWIKERISRIFKTSEESEKKTSQRV